MESYYLAKKPNKNSSSFSYSLESDIHVFEDAIFVPTYQKRGFDCYLITELKKIIDFETFLVFEECDEIDRLAEKK